MDSYHGGSHSYVSRISTLGILSLSPHTTLHVREAFHGVLVLEYVQIIVLIPVTRLDSLHVHKI